MYFRYVRTGIYMLKWLVVASIVGFGASRDLRDMDRTVEE